MRRELYFMAAMALSSPSWADDDATPPDVVFLKDGGRVRGEVVEEDPTTGVRIKLLDGKIMSLPHARVDHVQYGKAQTPTPPTESPTPTPPPTPSFSPPPQMTGKVKVEAPAPATVFIDDGQVGRTPLHLDNVPYGRHRVRVAFDGGGSWSQRVTVFSGSDVDLRAEYPAMTKAFADRRGFHFGATGEYFFGVLDINAMGARITPYVNYGASPAVEVRLGVPLIFGSGGMGGYYNQFLSGEFAQFVFSAGVAASLRLNLAPFYTMTVGASGGLWIWAGTFTVDCRFAGCSTTDPPWVSTQVATPDFFAEVSPITIRFGAHGEYELSYTAALGVVGGYDATGTPADPGVEAYGTRTTFANFFGFSFTPAFGASSTPSPAAPQAPATDD